MGIYKVPSAMRNELEELMQQADKLLTAHKADFVCKSGCSGCCESFLWNLIEIINVREDGRYRRVMKKLRKRIKSYEKEYHNRKKILGELAKNQEIFIDAFKDMRCVFLYENRCLIYESRPILCRLFASRDINTCNGLYELPEDYHTQANDILNRAFLLNSRFTQIFHPDCTIQGLPFRYLFWDMEG
jgi:Fe-S-cluster containining protein